MASHFDPTPEDDSEHFNDPKGYGYTLSGKIMLVSIIVLFFVIVIVVSLHLYARWYLLHARRHHLRRNRLRRRTNIVFDIGPSGSAAGVVIPRGLDFAILKSLPVFKYSSKPEAEPLECAVCLSEFEEGETGRVLPNCNHSFHIDCIDMWFHTHSTCPLCRSPVEPRIRPEEPPEFLIFVPEPEGKEPVSISGSSSSARGLCSECQNGDAEIPAVISSPGGARRKPSAISGMSIDVPRRNEGFGRPEDELGCESPVTPSSFRSPMSRMLSFKRILSRDRDRRFTVSSCSAEMVGCSSLTEADIERGGGKEGDLVS